MNSKFFSIDSLIGIKQNNEDKSNPVSNEDESEIDDIIGNKVEDDDSQNSSNNNDNRRLKIPSFHASIRENVQSCKHELLSNKSHETHMPASTMSDPCRPKSCSSHNAVSGHRFEDHRNLSGETCSNSCKLPPKQKRLSLTKHQLGELEKCFLKNYYPTEATREELALRLGLSHARVKVWFQNRRAKWQRNQKIKTEWQSFLHNPFTAAIGLSHQRLLLQHHHHQLLTEAQTKDYDPQNLQTPIHSLYSFPHSSLAYMLPRQDLMSYGIGKPPMQSLNSYIFAKQAAVDHDNGVKLCLTDDSDSEESGKSVQNKNAPNGTSASTVTDKPAGLQAGQFWW